MQVMSVKSIVHKHHWRFRAGTAIYRQMASLQKVISIAYCSLSLASLIRCYRLSVYYISDPNQNKIKCRWHINNKLRQKQYPHNCHFIAHRGGCHCSRRCHCDRDLCGQQVVQRSCSTIWPCSYICSYKVVCRKKLEGKRGPEDSSLRNHYFCSILSYFLSLIFYYYTPWKGLTR